MNRKRKSEFGLPPLIYSTTQAVPPKIVDDQTSSDLVVRENSVVNLTCQAEGWPKPELRWRRADGEMIKYQGGTGKCKCEIVRWFPDINSGSTVMRTSCFPQ